MMMKKLLIAVAMLGVLSISAGTLRFECSVNSKDAIFMIQNPLYCMC